MRATLLSAHNRFLHWEPYLGLLIGMGFFTWVAKHGRVMGIDTWEEAVFVGAGAAAVLMLALAAIFAAYRYFSPLAAVIAARNNPEPASDHVPAVYDDTKLRVEFAELKAQRDAIINDYQRMLGVEARLDAALAELIPLPAKVEDIRTDGAATLRELEKLADEFKKLHERTGASFIALQQRELLSLLGREIRQVAADMYDRFKAGEVYDGAAWQQWESDLSRWNRLLNQWLAVGTWYAAEVKKRTLTVDDAKYGGDWSIRDEQFPDSVVGGRSEAVRRFKKFRIIQTQWEEVTDEVNRGITLVAFSGLTEKEARGGQPAG